MKLLSNRMERALWFADSFGLKLNSLSLVDKETGQKTQITFGRNEKKRSRFLPVWVKRKKTKLEQCYLLWTGSALVMQPTMNFL